MAIARVVCASREIEAVAHLAGCKALDDVLGGFDLVERHGSSRLLFRRLDAEQATDRQQLVVLLVQELRIVTIAVARIAAHRMLEQRDRLRRPGMDLAADAVGIVAPDRQSVAIDRGIPERVGMAPNALLRDLIEADSADPRRGAGEILLDEGFRQADGIEDLRAAVGLVGRNAHLRHDLEKALADRLDVALDRLVAVDLLGKGLRHRREGFESQVGVDRLRSETGQKREMMHFAGFTRLDDEGRPTCAGPSG